MKDIIERMTEVQGLFAQAMDELLRDMATREDRDEVGDRLRRMLLRKRGHIMHPPKWVGV